MLPEFPPESLVVYVMSTNSAPSRHQASSRRKVYGPSSMTALSCST